jgi:hypothetical protein
VNLIRREGSIILFALSLTWAPLVTACDLSNFRFSSGGAALCGEVQALDLFAQSFLIRQDRGKVETVPFSRWTEFFRILPDAKGETGRQAIEPTEVEPGDRLCILLDPSEATAASILVLPSRVARPRSHVVLTRNHSFQAQSSGQAEGGPFHPLTSGRRGALALYASQSAPMMSRGSAVRTDSLAPFPYDLRPRVWVNGRRKRFGPTLAMETIGTTL